MAARCDCDAVVNIQGDEPLIDPAVVDAAAVQALTGSEMSTAATPVQNLAEYDNPNVVKVVVNRAGHAYYIFPAVMDSVSARGRQSFRKRTVGGVSIFETSRDLWIPADDTVAPGAVSRFTAGERGEIRAIAGIG